MTQPASAQTDGSASPHAARPRGCVLVIEPDADVARMLEVRLAREGYDVLAAETGQGGQYLADQQLVDLVLLDRNLSDMASLDLLRQLRASPSPCEVIMMTVDPTIEIFVEALDAGAFDLVVKPFSNLKLVTAKVRNAVGKVQAERARDELAARLLDAEQASASVPTEVVLPPPGRSGRDTITGLPDWVAADHRFQEETARALRYSRPLTVVFLSVERLDAVIEAGGADAMEEVLRQVADEVRRLIRDVDFLARRDGGEFMLLLPETIKADGAVVAERIRARIAEAPFAVATNEGPFELTASFGVAGLPTDTMNVNLLRQAGEVALARAEATGNSVVLYEPSNRR